MKRPNLAIVALGTVGSTLGAQEPPGYTDTPAIPDSEWRVHDAARPRPKVVDPGPPAAPAPRPTDAIALFDGDGNGLEAWVGREGPAKWRVVAATASEPAWFEVNGTGDIRTAESFGDCQLHLEWAAPAEVKGSSQGRGNSGVFLMGRYEVQILDSYDNPSYADGQAAALYGQYPPLVNACRPPGEWQSYDIVFRAPRFEGERLLEPARVTVFHNGVLVHHARELLGATAHRRAPSYTPHGDDGIRLQDHGNPVRFRNIWVRRLDGAGEGPIRKPR